MPGDDAFQVEGVVLEAQPNGTYRVELANGHRLLGFIPGKLKSACGRLAVGSKVKLQLSPYDLSEGRIILPERPPKNDRRAPAIDAGEETEI